jgi:hypothetical protein
VAGEQHRHALIGQLAHQRGDTARAAGIKAARRLVQQEQARGAQQRGGDAQALAHPRGVAAHPARAAIGQADARQHVVDEARGHVAVELGQQREVDATRQVGIEARLLHEAGDVVERRRARAAEGTSQQRDRARVGRDQPEQQPQQRRLAGAVGPQQPVNLAGLHDQVQVVHGRRRLEALDQPSGGDGLHGGHYEPRAAPALRYPRRSRPEARDTRPVLSRRERRPVPVQMAPVRSRRGREPDRG